MESDIVRMTDKITVCSVDTRAWLVTSTHVGANSELVVIQALPTAPASRAILGLSDVKPARDTPPTYEFRQAAGSGFLHRQLTSSWSHLQHVWCMWVFAPSSGSTSSVGTNDNITEIPPSCRYSNNIIHQAIQAGTEERRYMHLHSSSEYYTTSSVSIQMLASKAQKPRGNMATMEVLQWLQESYWTSSNTFFSDNLPATTWGTKNPNHVANMSFEDIDSFNQGKDGLLMPRLNISSLNIRDPSQPMTSAANLGLATGFLLVVLLNSHFETIKYGAPVGNKTLVSWRMAMFHKPTPQWYYATIREWRNEYQQWAETVLARTVFVIACLLLSLAVTPLVMLIFISLMFYRQTVQVILWLVHGKRFAGLMEGADTVWALEDDMSKSVINILAMLQVSSTDESLGEGLLTSLRQLVLSRILTSPQRCPKLLYYRRKSALGYFYWERQNELHLENHIRWMETGMDISDGISEEILGGVVSELANAPLPDQHASSWEILVGRNFISEPNMNVKTSLEEDFPSAIPDNSNHRSQSPRFDKETPRCSSAMSGFVNPDFPSAIPDNSNHRSQSPRRGSPSRLDLNTDKPATFISSGSQPDDLSSCKNTLEDNNFPSNYKQICDNKSFAAVGVGSNEYQPRSSTNVEQGKNLSKELKDIKNDSLFTTIPLDMIGKRPMTPTDYCSKVSSSLGGWQVLKNMFSKKKSNKMFVKKTKGTSSSNKYVKLLSTINNGEVSKYRCIGNFMHVICAIIYAPASLLHQALMKASDANTLHGPSLSGQKVIAWYTDSSTSTLDDEGQLLNTIKRIKSRAMCEARFTDIFLTALSASLEAYFLTGSNDNTIPESINVVVPIRMEPFPTKAVEIIKDEDSSKVLKYVSVEDTTQFMPTILEDLNELNHDYVVTEKRLNSILKNRSFTKDINPGLTFVDISEDKTSSNLLLDNRFSVALMTLPIVPPSCATSEKILKSYTLRSRLKEVCVQSELLRKSLDYQINYWLMRVVATVLPVALLSPVLRSTQSTMVVSNMKGPAEDVQIGGYKLSDLVFWVPNRGTTGVGVTLMSYAGRLQIGIIADRAVVPCRQDAQLILQGVVSELKYLDAMTSV
uniref:O-acyltransferase WSD1 C-terminal domain-containing protein n=1 Tax=Timema cristinae TaxID=61476 RepID=A0A7R9GZ24_TIMCR|nr:unnamed protein product [Timema cristinae]